MYIKNWVRHSRLLIGNILLLLDLTRGWYRLQLFCNEALMACKSYQELCESVESMSDILGDLGNTVKNSTTDDSNLQVGHRTKLKILETLVNQC